MVPLRLMADEMADAVAGRDFSSSSEILRNVILSDTMSAESVNCTVQMQTLQ